MALLFVDSFDHYTTVQGIQEKWYGLALGPGSTTDIGVGEGRFGTDALRLNDFGIVTGQSGPHFAFPETGTLIVGFAFRLEQDLSIETHGMLLFWDRTTLQCYLQVNTDGSLSFLRGDNTVIATSAAGVVVENVYAYYEVKVTIGNSGTVEVRKNEIAVINASAVDIDETGTGFATQVQLGGNGGANDNGYFDDFYLCDTTGSRNNDFLGDVHIEAQFPNNPGAFSDFGLVDTGLTATQNYETVDESPHDDDVTFNVGSAIGQKDTFYFGSPTIDVPIFGIAVTARLRKETAGSRNMALAHYHLPSATLTLGTALYFGGEYRAYQQFYPQHPVTGSAWDVNAVGTAQFGYQIVAPPS